MLESVLGPPVSVCSTRTDTAPVVVHAEEETDVARAVPARRAEYATVRHCARTALRAIDVPPGPLPRGAGGAPVWPAEVVGSMTHCRGYRAAAVARTVHVRSLGIDAEPDEPLPRGVLELVTRPGERAALPLLQRSRPGVHWDRLTFSAKESVYKAWFPLTGRWLDFDDAEVHLTPDGGLVAELLVPGPRVDGAPLTRFTGRWSVASGIITTAVVVPAGSD
ncbi:4'-phosphopantetheinyl transferase [Modestobacter sp. Leaf380]|uniref:4'-phosphopantetheinyl transferase family protein n=1 Tax=Modestobacter sp. Leaf380 TaxID=1736356 RepID=UPI0007001503|nr:4'-phosphopantetheinyl transferase superfamily protein [Modestobacter sp. Leaf380]KQS63685.1 4'-phosphopantetheinyl transferase [Modestobacter sp. Leaf380]